MSDALRIPELPERAGPPQQWRNPVRSAMLSAKLLRPMVADSKIEHDPPPGITAAEFVQSFVDADLPEYAEAARVVVAFAEAVHAAGGRALLVGGGVRDLLLGGVAKDFDIEVSRLQPEEVAALVGTVGIAKDVGKSYAVLKLPLTDIINPETGKPIELDISLPRTDSKIGDGHRDFHIDAQPFLPDREAFRRRDFTINAMGADLVAGTIIDPFNGMQDLRDRVLRVVDPETFVEDPLRALRALQFIARFNLKLDPASAELLRAMPDQLRHLPKERIYDEWKKLLTKAEKPSVGLRAGMDLGLYPALHPELAALVDTPQHPDIHPEGDVWTHTWMVADEAAALIRAGGYDEEEATLLMLAAVCHDLGKPATAEAGDGGHLFPKHGEAGVAPTLAFLSQLGFNGGSDVARKVSHLVADHQKPSKLAKADAAGTAVSDGTIRRLAARLYPATIRQLALVSDADRLGRGNAPNIVPGGAWLTGRAESLGVDRTKPSNLVEGQEILDVLGCKPGKLIGDIIRLANDLRDDLEVSREQVLARLTGMHDPAEAIVALERMRGG